MFLLIYLKRGENKRKSKKKREGGRQADPSVLSLLLSIQCCLLAVGENRTSSGTIIRVDRKDMLVDRGRKAGYCLLS